MESLKKLELPPVGVCAATSVCACMAVGTFILGNTSPPAATVGEQLLWIIHCDMFEIQNLGHAAFLLMFATSWWKNGNIVGVFMTQLAALFVLPTLACFCAVGIRILLVSGNENPRVVTGIVWTFVFTFCSLVSLIITSKKDFAKRFSVFNTLIYTTKDKYSFLRSMLFIQIFIQVLEPILIGATRLSREWIDVMEPEITHQLALPVRGYMESYTLVFHQAFAMSLALASISLPDEDKDIYVVAFAALAQVVVATGFFFGGVMIPSDSFFLAVNILKVTIHSILFVQFIEMLRLVFSQRLKLKKLKFVPKLHAEPTVSNERDPEHRSLWTIAFSGDNGIPSKTITHARQAFAVGVLFGLLWQFQAFVLVALAHRYDYRDIDASNSLRYGLNFGMHGAGITAFDMVLCFRNLNSWRFMKLAAIGGCFGGALSSLGHVYRVYSLGHHRDKVYVLAFFGLRAAVSFIFGFTLSKLDFQSDVLYGRVTNEDSNSESTSSTTAKEAKEETSSSKSQSIDLDNVEITPLQYIQGHTSSSEMYACAIYAFSVLLYAFAAVLKFRFSGAVSSGFIKTDAESGGGWRIVEFAPGYGLVYHFLLILGGFANHWFSFRFEPSRWVAIFFAGSSMLIAAFQVLVLTVTSTNLVDKFVLAASLLFSLTSGILIWFLYTSKSKKGFNILYGDLWH